MFRRLGSSLAQHRASLSAEFGSLWEFILDRNADRQNRARRRSAPAATSATATTATTAADRAPHRLARDLLQVVQETVFAKKFDERRCPLVKEESDLSSEEGNDRRIANLIDFFFTIVKSQKDDRKSSSGSCFKTESPTEARPRKVNAELEKKMETLMEFLATTGCMDDAKDEKKITLMEFLFGPENMPIIEIDALVEKREMTLSESNINVKLSYIDETPIEEGGNLVDMLIKYMESYEKEPHKSMSLTPSLSEKSKSDVTISKLETFDNISKTKSDSTLTHTQDTVIERELDIKSDKSSRRISETVVDLSNVKQDLEDIFEEAVIKVCELQNIELEEQNDTMSEAEDIQNFHSYTKPPLYSVYMPYSVELSDILEEDESLDPSSRGMLEDRMSMIRECAEDLLDYIEDKIQRHFDESSEDEFDISSSMKRSSISLFDLRLIPDLPPSMIIKPKVKRIDRSTSTTEISDSISELSKRVESGNLTEDTSLSNSSDRQAGRALDKLESLHKFFSRSRLDIIKEINEEEKNEKKKRPRSVLGSETKSSELKPGQASLDDVEELQDEVLDSNDVEKLSDDVIVEENERDVKNEDLFKGTDNVLSDEVDLKRNEDVNIEDGAENDFNVESKCATYKSDVKIGTVSEEMVTEERTEDLVINDDDGLKINEDNINGTTANDANDIINEHNELINNKDMISKNDQAEFSINVKNLEIDNDCMVGGNSVAKSEGKLLDLANNISIVENKVTKLNIAKTCRLPLTEPAEGHVNLLNKVDEMKPKLKENKFQTDDKEISDTDFTEIDKIITEAIKIILVNELEFHDSEQKSKQKEAKSNENKQHEIIDDKTVRDTNIPKDFDSEKECIEHEKELIELKSKAND